MDNISDMKLHEANILEEDKKTAGTKQRQANTNTAWRIREIHAEYERTCERIIHKHGYTIAQADSIYHEDMLQASDDYHEALESADK